MKITTLEDAAEYQRNLLQRMKTSGKATENDIYMSRHILEIIEDRIRTRDRQK